MTRGYEFYKLGGMYSQKVFADFPRVNILRPLLEVRMAALQEVCQNEGVEWIEDLSFNLARNNIRMVLRENEELVPGIIGLMKTCEEARRHLKQQGITMYVIIV